MKRPIVAITGATGGIGAALSKLAVHTGYDLILHGRSEAKLAELRDRLTQIAPVQNTELVVGDLGSAAGAHRVAASISERAPRLHRLFNNAGVLLDGIQISPDGVEMHTQVNLIAPYILMQALQPNVAQAAGSIVNVSSGSALRVKALSVQALKRPMKAKKLFGAYAESKLALSVVTQALGEAYAADDIVLACADPGPNKTNMTSGEGMPGFLRLLRPLFYASPETGAAKVFGVSEIAKASERPGAFYSGQKMKDLPEFVKSGSLSNELLEFCEASAQPQPMSSEAGK